MRFSRKYKENFLKGLKTSLNNCLEEDDFDTKHKYLCQDCTKKMKEMHKNSNDEVDSIYIFTGEN